MLRRARPLFVTLWQRGQQRRRLETLECAHAAQCDEKIRDSREFRQLRRFYCARVANDMSRQYWDRERKATREGVVSNGLEIRCFLFSSGV